MSRIGRMPIAIPAEVTVVVAENNKVTVKGPKGTLERVLAEEMTIAVEDGQVVVTRPNDLKRMKALHGLTRSLINNAVVGVVNGYKKELAIVGVGYKAALEGTSKLTLTVGLSHPVVYTVPEGIKVTVTEGTKILLEGFDKQLVGECAARIRRFRKPEPYKGKGIRYADEHVVIKPGKTNA